MHGAPRFELVQALLYPVITREMGMAQGINYGFEGGLYTKSGGLYHLFPTESPMDIPHMRWDIHMTGHHWTSPNGMSDACVRVVCQATYVRTASVQ